MSAATDYTAEILAWFASEERYLILEGKSEIVAPQIPDCSVDAVVSDPPAGIAFMGKAWDDDKGGKEHWIAWLAGILREAFRVLKPGGHMFLWALPRTSHWTAEAIERAGFEIRDVLTHHFGSGFPKSLDVSKVIDARRIDDIRHVCRFLRSAMNAAGLSSADISARFGFHSRMVDHWAARDSDSQPTVPTVDQWERLRGLLGFGAEMDAEVARLNSRKGERGEAWANREIIGEHEGSTPGLPGMRFSAETKNITAPSLPEARRWFGWGTALKPASEFWIMARKPLSGTVAANVLAHGTGAINVDAARVGTDVRFNPPTRSAAAYGGFENCAGEGSTVSGRWPANLALSHAAWEETHCPCGAVLSFVARFCPECGSDAVEHRRAGCCAVGERRVSGNSMGAMRTTALGSMNDDTWQPQQQARDPNGYADPDGLETVTAWECLATCACGLSTLAPSGGAPPCCRCGRAMVWACPVARLDEQSSSAGMHSAGGASESVPTNSTPGYGGGWGNVGAWRVGDTDQGSSASRFFNTFAPPDNTEPFFYCAKPSAAETEAGCERLPARKAHENVSREEGSAGMNSPRAGAGRTSGRKNHHPTKKGIDLMRHFCRLACRKGGIVLDLFGGSGTTVCAGALEEQRVIAIEMDPEFVAIGKARAAFWARLAGTQIAARETPTPKREEADARQVTIFDLIGGKP